MKDVEYTEEQQKFINHPEEVFLDACPGSGKTRAIIGRVQRLSDNLALRRGIAVLSFTNTAVDEFKRRCQSLNLQNVTVHPGFVGTFDAFVRHFFVMPAGIRGVSQRPAIVESWSSLGIEVRLRGSNAFRGNGVPLDYFDEVEGTIDPSVIGHTGLRAHVVEHKDDYERAASSYRYNLHQKGILSTADARVIALQNLSSDRWAESLGTAIASRFSEIIVDEAQDCNPLDLAILDWLRDHRLPVTVVCDPDQAIYGFRRGNEDQEILNEFSRKYDEDNIFGLTGNFRSGPNICSLAATLRDRKDPDNPKGRNNAIRTEIQILEYGGPIPGSIGKLFNELIMQTEISPDKSFVLSHKRNSALRASGVTTVSNDLGTSKVSILARAVAGFWASSGSNHDKEVALRHVERLILQLMGIIDNNEPLQRAIEQNGIDARWLRRLSLELVMAIPSKCDDTDDARSEWLSAMLNSVRNLGLAYGDGKSERRFFRRPSNNHWCQILTNKSVPDLRCATVHEAKGREYEAVCLVIPPNRAPQNHTEQLMSAWERGSNDESKRVAYVAVTRAEKMVSIAIPKAYRARLTEILDKEEVPWVIHDLDMVE
ncbi:MAG: ATP-dependent helicase [Candidatus Thiodiazotropha endolucinida]